MSSRGRAAVHDLVHVRFGFNPGKTEPKAVFQPTREEQLDYGAILRDELDGFIGSSEPTRHAVEILTGGGSGMVSVDLVRGIGRTEDVIVRDASSATSSLMAEARSGLIERRTQWLYFNRNLRVYEGSRTYILKPLQRMHWTRTQAIEDAREIIADSLRPAPLDLVGAGIQ